MTDAKNLKENFDKIINSHDEFIIIPHYNPDPDALGSSFALQYLISKIFDKSAKIYYSGIIGRAENIKMVQMLDIQLLNLKEEERLPDLPVILMDTQPDTGNNPLKSRKNLKIVFDHHHMIENTNRIKFYDVRNNCGSTSSIIYDYFIKYGLKPIINVATALYYGIQSDVVGEGRSAFKIDFNYMEALSAYISREKLYSIENPQLPFEFYFNISKGMENSVIYDDFLITTLGKIENPDYIGQTADFLIRYNKCNLILVMGIHNNYIQLSFRSQKKKINAAKTLKSIIGEFGTAGGHDTSAGGRIILNKKTELAHMNKKLINKALMIIKGRNISGIPFLSLGDYLNY